MATATKFLECPNCGNKAVEAEVTVLSWGFSGTYWEPPEPLELEWEIANTCSECKHKLTAEEIEELDEQMYQLDRYGKLDRLFDDYVSGPED